MADKPRRVVPPFRTRFQELVAPHMSVEQSRVAGRGVFWRGTEALATGKRIGVYAGAVTSAEPADTTYTLSLGPRTHVDGSRHGNWTQFINDPRGTGKAANVMFTTDGSVLTLRAIQPGEELLIDYGAEYWEDDDRRVLAQGADAK